MKDGDDDFRLCSSMINRSVCQKTTLDNPLRPE
jgi:hypothetical protein